MNRIYELINKTNNIKNLNEIDWNNTFNDVNKTCLSQKELVELLKNTLNNKNNNVYIHKNNIKINDNEIDVNAFINLITKTPDNILSQNEKMKKTSKDGIFVMNIGIPAVKGIVYDIDNKKFYTVVTCPGAGSCLNICYARRGFYIYLSAVSLKQTRILNLLLNNPDKFKKILISEIENMILKQPNNVKFKLRWNDAGDFFAKKYYQIAIEVTKELKNRGYDIESYTYTKVADIYNDKSNDITKTFSTGAAKKEMDKINLDTATLSIIIPKTLIKDLFVTLKNGRFDTDNNGHMILKYNNSFDKLKEIISKEYNLDKNTIITNDELDNIIKSKNDTKFNVIILPGDNDIAALKQYKNKIKNILLIQH